VQRDRIGSDATHKARSARAPYPGDVKLPAPVILRKGVVVRIAGAEDQTSAAANAYAIAFVDLRYDDGHVERWLGSGELRDDPLDPVPYAELMAWATEVAKEHSLSGDLGMSFSDVNRAALVDAAVEVVYEWNATLPDLWS
jgi:hypothetical protein